MPSSQLATTAADRAFLLALRAWGVPVDAGFWERFAPTWRVRLRSAWEERFAHVAAEEARPRLACDHHDEVAADPARVHPSWWARALQDETPAVRRTILSTAPEPISLALLGRIPDDATLPHPDRPPHPDVVRWVQSFWAERLVGGPPPHRDDPPAVIAVTTFDRRSLHRLVSTAGLAKWALADAADDAAKSDARDALRDRPRARFDAFRSYWGLPDDADGKIARRDLDANRGGTGPGPDLRKLGLVTLARLLTAAEPFRARWTLQHLPYGIAKFVRARMTLASPWMGEDDLAALETRVLDMAWNRLISEGRLTLAAGEAP